MNDPCAQALNQSRCTCNGPHSIRRYVWLLTCGSGEDGDEWNVESIHSTEANALAARDAHADPADWYIERWELHDGEHDC